MLDMDSRESNNKSNNKSNSKSDNKSDNRSGSKPINSKHGILSGARGGMAGFLLVLAAASLVMVLSVAWYMYSRRSEQQELKITSDSTELALSGCALYYGELQTSGDNKGKYIGTLVTEPDNLSEMNDYDAVMGRNDDTAAFICLTISGTKVKAGELITVTVSRANRTDIDNPLPTGDDGFKYDSTDESQHCVQGEIARYLSNIITLQILQMSSGDTGSTGGSSSSGAAALDMQDADAVYQACKKLGWSDSDASSFITPIPEAKGRDTVLASDAEKATSLTFSLSGYEKTDYGDSATAVFFMRIDYSQALIEAYLNGNHEEMSGRLNQQATENFVGDISGITITTQ